MHWVLKAKFTSDSSVDRTFGFAGPNGGAVQGWGLGVRVWGLGFGVWGLGFGFRVEG